MIRYQIHYELPDKWWRLYDEYSTRARAQQALKNLGLQFPARNWRLVKIAVSKLWR